MTRRGGSFDDRPTHALTGEGFDANEDGTGRGTPLVPVEANRGDLYKCGTCAGVAYPKEHTTICPTCGADDLENVMNRPTMGPHVGEDFDFDSQRWVKIPGAIPILEAGARTGKSTDDPRAGIGIGKAGDPMFTLQSTKQHAVAFSCKNDNCIYWSASC